MSWNLHQHLGLNIDIGSGTVELRIFMYRVSSKIANSITFVANRCFLVRPQYHPFCKSSLHLFACRVRIDEIVALPRTDNVPI